jgi:nicotinamidase-related amidase
MIILTNGHDMLQRDAQDWSQFVVLLIDVQRSFWPTERGQLFPHVADNIRRLLTFCRTAHLDVVHVRSRFQPDMSDWMPPFKVRQSTPCVAGTPGMETLPFAIEHPHEPVMFKHTLDGFHNPALLAYLQQHHKRFVLTAGLVTSTCVLFTTASAMQHGFLTAVVEDCCADHLDAHTRTLAQYGFIFGRTTVAQLSARYLGWCGTLRALDPV